MPEYPATRMRRLRSRESVRQLIRESELLPSHLIYPVFVCEDESLASEDPTLPDLRRRSLSDLGALAKELISLGIPAIAIFPVISAEKKDEMGASAADPNGLVPRAIHEIRAAEPGLTVITDIALDPYTTHGQDGVLDDDGEIDNDATIERLIAQALCHAEAGAGAVAPSDMMDGRIGNIRSALEGSSHHQVLLISYAAKYASCLYAPFRDAVGSATALGAADKRTYQMDPANGAEALREVALDIEEGADIALVKPGLSYLDVVQRLRAQFEIPLFVYFVSGEYAMLRSAVQAGYLDEKKAVLETHLACRRAGANAIMSYHATALARWLGG